MFDPQAHHVEALNKFYKNAKVSFAALHHSSSEASIYLELTVSDVEARIELTQEIVAKMIQAAKKSIDQEFKVLYDTAKAITDERNPL